MNDSTLNLNAPLPDGAALNPTEQALLNQFLALPAWQLLRYLRVLHQWERAPASRRALALKLLNAGLSAKDVAWLCGRSERQLRRYPEFRAATLLLGEQGNRPPRGAKGRDGEIEAWDREE
jgi:hypothetical protein